MAELAQRDCEKCGKDTPAMSRDAALALMAQLPEWQLHDDAKGITRRFAFRNFKQSLAFVNALGVLAEAEFHHPDIKLGWGYAEVTYMTHSIDGLHINDFILAARTDALV
jgi:4a-hydroxytetrahydrobiopterin dehydratase